MTPPLTGNETHGGWTSITHEGNFLDQLADETSAVVSQVGETVQGLPIRRLDLGTGTDNTILYVGHQHASEPSGREAVLAMVRDLAYSTDPETLAYLDTHRVVIVPTVNADGGMSDRLNANGININRDHYRLSQPESRAVAQVIKETQPGVIFDLHENGVQSLPDWAGTPEPTPGTYSPLVVLGEDAYDHVVASVISQGRTAGRYPKSSTPVSSLSASAGSHHAVGIVSEPTNRVARTERVAGSRMAVDAIREWHREHAAELQAARVASLHYARTTTDSVPLMTTEMTTGTPIMLDIVGYQLQGALPDHVVDLHGIEVDGDFVSVNQAARLAVVMLCDPESPDSMVTATRVPRHITPSKELPRGYWAETYFMTSQGKRKVSLMKHHDGTRVRTVSPTGKNEIMGWLNEV